MESKRERKELQVGYYLKYSTLSFSVFRSKYTNEVETIDCEDGKDITGKSGFLAEKFGKSGCSL